MATICHVFYWVIRITKISIVISIEKTKSSCYRIKSKSSDIALH